MKTATSSRKVFAVGLTAAMVTGLLAATGTSAWAATPNTLDLRVLVIGNGSTDVTTAAWESALTTEGVPYTEVDATGTSPSQTVTLPALSSGTTGYFDGVVIADSPTDFAAGALTALDTYESTFGVRQVDGYMYPDPNLGVTEASGGALDGTTGALTTAGLAAFPSLAGPVPFATGTYGYGATVDTGAPYTALLSSGTVPAGAVPPTGESFVTAGQVLGGIYQHPSTDPQAGVAELSLYFDYNSTQLQWLLLAPGLINWVTQGTHLGLDRNYVEMDIDDTFTPDNAWSTTVHDNDYSDADSQRMDAQDVITAADWSDPTAENTPSARPAGEPTTAFRLDQLFNYGGTVEYQDGELDLPGEPASCDTGTTPTGTCGPDPLLAEFQATDPATGKPYADDFGWLSHTFDTPYLDVGCATQDYIEAELNENTTDVTAAPGTTPGTGGLGLPEQTIATGATDVTNPLGTYNPQVFVPGNHSGFADLDPGTPATVDPPDLDLADTSATGGSLASGTYEYAVTDQFNGADSTTTDQSQAYVTDGLQGDVAPVVVTGPTGSVSLVWQAICHAANYIIYRSAAPYTSWTEIGTYATPDSATLPDDSSADSTPASPGTVCQGADNGEGPDPTSCAGEQELTFNDTGATSGTSGSITYMDVPMPAGWTPPVVENANELPWEQNPYFTPALQAMGITTVGADGSKAYPDPADDPFGIGVAYPTGDATYAAAQPFVEDGTGTYSYQVAPRHPINVFYNVATNAQELDEYNTLYDEDAPGSQCHSTSVTTCATTPYTFADVINQVVTGMLQNMLSNSPEVSYVHQTNLMGTPPYSTTLPPANYVPAATAATGTDGDGTLYEVLNPLISEYDSYFNSTTPYVQLTLGGIGNVLADQTNWSNVLSAATPTVTASETNGVVAIANTGAGAVNVPVTVPTGTTVSSGTVLPSYEGELSNWLSVAGTSSQTLTEAAVAPAITSSTSATAIVGTPFSFTVTTTGVPVPALTESGALPSGLTFIDNGNGTATIAGTPATGSGAIYPITITATGTGTASQQFTLTVNEAPSITSASTATFWTGLDSTYDITTTGYPGPALTEAGALPAGLTFADNGNGTGTITGEPTATPGTYPVSVSATNASGSTATLALTITVGAGVAPGLTIPDADFTINKMGSVVIDATGSPMPSLTETGALPAGLTFTDNLNGTATITGDPSVSGTTAVTITASNGISPAATGILDLVVGQAPGITSANSATATVGALFNFTVTTAGYPAPSLGITSGALPSGLTFQDNGNGTATISGTPAANTQGAYPVTLTAANGTGTATQAFTITVAETPTISSADSATAVVGTAFDFPVTDASSPAPTIVESGALPSGITFTDNGNGTATISGTPAAGTGGMYSIVITASNSAGVVTQNFTLIVDQAASVTSPNTTTFAAKSNGSFSVTATGYPAPTLTETGALPSGVSFTDPAAAAGATSSTAALAGTPPAGSQGTYPITITATAAGTASTTQSFTLVVNSGLAITSASSATATAGTAFTFPITTTGTPTPTVTHTGTLPAGLTFTATSGGATLAGTPATTDSGTYSLTFTAKNSTGTASQSFTLTIDQTPSFTSATSATETAGTAFSFLVSAKGYPAPTISESTATGTSLPTGVTFAPGASGSGTGTLSGSTTVAGTTTVTFTANNGATSVNQSFTLTVKAAGTTVPVPTFTSAATDTVSTGKAFTFTVTTMGSPTTTYTTRVTHTGTLPAGVSFSNNGNGTATISGTPTAASGGVYTITLTATNSAGTTTQTFTLTVGGGPTITSAASATATVGSTFSFTVKATGAPVPTMTESGLPTGLTWTDNGNGTATLAGIAEQGEGGVHTLTLGATNTAGSTTQTFTLTIDEAPAITSATSATATHGVAFPTFTFTSTGYPVPTVTHTGTVKGLTYTRNTNGTATLSGTPTTAGVYNLTITATNSVGAATQTFTLTVS